MISVAARFGITLTALARVNNIADPTLIYVGQTLLIPPPPDEADEPLLTIAPATDPALPSIQPTLAPTTTRLWG
ncbi:MAG TPA: hypothetical protein DEP69_06585 [Acidimicrobiaceae bacterium]|nr:hypothetical protein [Acidimicrobiaceae bacterium]